VEENYVQMPAESERRRRRERRREVKPKILRGTPNSLEKRPRQP
jgi:hypothetical protein